MNESLAFIQEKRCLPHGGTEVLSMSLVDDPSVLKSSKVIVAGLSDVFVTATPVCIEPAALWIKSPDVSA